VNMNLAHYCQNLRYGLILDVIMLPRQLLRQLSGTSSLRTLAPSCPGTCEEQLGEEEQLQLQFNFAHGHLAYVTTGHGSSYGGLRDHGIGTGQDCLGQELNYMLKATCALDFSEANFNFGLCHWLVQNRHTVYGLLIYMWYMLTTSATGTSSTLQRKRLWT
jgi:hypothetical protein